jgi:hypothetical protein
MVKAQKIKHKIGVVAAVLGGSGGGGVMVVEGAGPSCSNEGRVESRE